MEALTFLQWGFDGLLGFGLLWLAWRALACVDLFKAIVLFVAFGLLMSLAWVRLDAPDIALAEAAIGAGVTGALLLSALARLRTAAEKIGSGTPEQPAQWAVNTSEVNKPTPKASRWLAIGLLTLTTSGLGYVILSLAPHATGLSDEVAANLANSGVSNPVTAVLLNFRAYDTLLELVVLLLALLGVWSLDIPPARTEAAAGPVLDTLSRLLLPVLILVAAYLLWAGAHAPGGAFQAGSVLGAAGVLLLLSGWRLRTDSHQAALKFAMAYKIVLVAGPSAFVAIAALTLLSEGNLLTYSPAQANTLILMLESAATLSIGLILVGLFLGLSFLEVPANKEKNE